MKNRTIYLFVALSSAALLAQSFIDEDAASLPSNLKSIYETAKERLAKDFDEICPDTFCEGEFSNWTSLEFRCSLHQAQKTLHQCLWTLAASSISLNEETGELEPESKTVHCEIEVEGVDWLEFSQKTSQEGIRTQLSGKNHSIYDDLLNCGL